MTILYGFAVQSLEQIIGIVLKRNLDNDYDFGYVLSYVQLVIFGMKISKKLKKRKKNPISSRLNIWND